MKQDNESINGNAGRILKITSPVLVDGARGGNQQAGGVKVKIHIFNIKCKNRMQPGEGIKAKYAENHPFKRIRESKMLGKVNR